VAPGTSSLDPESEPVRVADSLETASNRSLVYVGQTGAVVSPEQVKRGLGVAALCVGVTVVAANWLFVGIFGAIGWVGTATFAFLMTRSLLLPFRLQKVASLMMQERYDEADALASRLEHRALANRVTRREALHARAQIANLRGNLVAALGFQEQVESLYRLEGKNTVQYRIHRYGQILTLANLGQTAQARVIFAEAGEEPEGDYLQLLHWTCELMLCFCVGSHELDDDELHLRGRRGIEVIPGTPLLALSAWGFVRSGDLDMAGHLMSVVRERWEPKMSRAMPKLAPWVHQAMEKLA
jgi:uncharacterized membrane protein